MHILQLNDLSEQIFRDRYRGRAAFWRPSEKGPLMRSARIRITHWFFLIYDHETSFHDNCSHRRR